MRNQKLICCIWSLLILVLCLSISQTSLADVLRIPEGAKGIEEEAFYGDASLVEVVLPDGIQEIGPRAFAECINLQRIRFHRGIESIGENAFAECPDLVAEVYKGSYAEQYCIDHEISYILIGEQTPETIQNKPIECPVADITEDGRIKLSWSAFDGHPAYAVYEIADETLILTAVVGQPFASLSGLPEGDHTFVVYACSWEDSSVLLSQASQPIRVRLTGLLSPGAPTWVSADETAPETVTLSWNCSAEKYTVLELFKDGTEMEILSTANTSVSLSHVNVGYHGYMIRAEEGGKTVTSAARWLNVLGSANEIDLDMELLELSVGDNWTVLAKPLPLGTTDNHLTWTMDDPAVASVNSEGSVTALSPGNTTLTVKTDSGASASCIIQVLSEVHSEDFVVQDGILTAYNGSALDVVIPDDLGIVSIGQKAFSNKAITSIKVPRNLQAIEEKAFYGCKSLQTADLSCEITKVSDGLFYNCESLTDVVLPYTVTEIGDNAFNNCKSLAVFNLPYSVTSIGSFAFYNCEGITCEIVIASPVESIGSYAFSYCRNVPAYVFSEDSHLTFIGDRAFSGNWKLTTISLPDTVESLGKGALSGCPLVNAKLPAYITEIPGSLFSGCSSLKSFTPPLHYTVIGDEAFKNTRIESFTVPEGVTKIGQYAFSSGSLTEIFLPESLTELGGHAFSNSGISRITIPGGVREIPAFCFEKCIYLKEVHFSEGLEIIGSFAFENSNWLEQDLVLPEGLRYIGSYAFFNVSQHSITITVPSTVEYIGTLAFNNKLKGYLGCKALEEAYHFEVIGEITERGILTAPEKVTFSHGNTLMLHPGETFQLVPVIGETELDLGYTYVTADGDVASVGQDNGLVQAKKCGKTTITVSSFNGKTCSCTVYVLPERYSTVEEWEAKLAEMHTEYLWEDFFHQTMLGGGTAPNGAELDGVHLEKITDAVIQKSYDLILGTKASTPEAAITRAYAVADAVMMQFSSTRVDYLNLDIVEKELKYVGMGQNAINKMLKLFAVDSFGHNYVAFRLSNGLSDNSNPTFKEEYEDYFNKNYKLEFKELSYASDAVSFAQLMMAGLQKVIAYQSVSYENVRPYIEQFRKSNKEILILAAELLEDYTTGEGGFYDVTAFYSVIPAAEKVTKKLLDHTKNLIRDVIYKALPKLKAFMGNVGILLQGVEAGVKINNMLMNLDEIQSAAFKAKYAVQLATDFRSTFRSRENVFQMNPMDKDAFMNYVNAYRAFRLLVTQEYKAFEKIPNAINKSLVNRISEFLDRHLPMLGIGTFTCDTSSLSGSVKMAATYLNQNLLEYGQAFFGLTRQDLFGDE